MNEWEIAAAVLAGALLPCLGVCALAGVADGLVAMELAARLRGAAGCDGNSGA